MRTTVVDLKDAFLAQCRRMIQTQVTSEESIDGRRVSTARNFLGAGSNSDSLLKSASRADLNVSTIHPGDVYFSDTEIVYFLNAAWEKLHENKCQAIKGALMDPSNSPSTIEAMIYEHDQLYMGTESLKAFEPSSGIFQKIPVQRLADKGNSIMFVLEGDVTKWGPPTIVSVAVLEYPSQIRGIMEPLVTKVCKLVGVHEISGFINLATNSRYASGAMYVHRKNFLGKSQDILEVFHKQETTVNFGGFACAMTYIRYPQPIVTENLTDENKKRVIEVSYGYEIAYTAAAMAMNKG